ncbi:3-oxoacyl-[acyl-carrier-protein] synthase 3 [Leuconostoc litchii]|nr:3-oxoacyl-[acyl-carrier-protein] synthase 3 [Leuconostoc litchii]
MSPDSLSPSTAAIVQANIGATNAFAFDLSAACSGFVYGMSIASSLLMTRYQRGIVIGAEVLSKLVDWKDRTTAVLFGDGAAGVLVERTQENIGLLGEELRTFGAKGDNLVAGQFANTNPFSNEISPLDPYFHQNGREVYSFATREVPEALQVALEKAQVSADDVDYYLLHQANSRIVSSIAKRFGQPLSKFPINMALNGNTSAASIGILLDELIESKQIHAGQTIAFAGFGGGLTVGAQIWKI